MAERFKKLDNILNDWEKDKYKKSIVEALSRYEKHSLANQKLYGSLGCSDDKN